MARYSEREKIEAARDRCRGHPGLRQVAQRHGVNVASLRQWAAAYRLHGTRGVVTKRRTLHTATFKLSVLQRLRSDEASRRQAPIVQRVFRTWVSGSSVRWSGWIS